MSAIIIPTHRPKPFSAAGVRTPSCTARLKVNVPRSLRVVGFDDVRYATLLPVQLTTMQQPCREIAVAAFQAMRAGNRCGTYASWLPSGE